MPTPTTISERYEVLERLDQGESGEVLKVRHRTLRSLSVLKVVSDESLSDPEAEAGFYRQANAAAVLHHPNIIRVLDVDRDEDLRIRYVVMEYIDGQTLDERLRDRGVLSLGETLDLCRQVGGAVAYAHRESESVTFRGITASNIFVEEGTNRFVVTGVGAADQTAAGSEGGSTGDLVSLGFLAYYAHTGALPPTGHDAPAPRELPFPQATPGPFRELVRKTLEGGYRTAEDFLGDVAAIHAPPTKPPEPPEPAHRPAREVDPPTAAQAPIPQAEPARRSPGPCHRRGPRAPLRPSRSLSSGCCWPLWPTTASEPSRTSGPRPRT